MGRTAAVVESQGFWVFIGIPLVLIAVFIGMDPGGAFKVFISLFQFLVSVVVNLGAFLIGSIAYIVHMAGVMVYNVLAVFINIVFDGIKHLLELLAGALVDGVIWVLNHILLGYLVEGFKKHVIENIDNALSWLPHLNYLQPPKQPDPFKYSSQLEDGIKNIIDSFKQWIEDVNKNLFNSALNGGLWGSITAALTKIIKIFGGESENSKYRTFR